MPLVINAFNGTDKITEIEFARAGSPVNFAAEGVTRVAIVAAGQSVDGTISGSVVKFKAGALGLKPGVYLPKVLAYTAEKPNGDPIAGPGEEIEIEMYYNN